MRRINNPNIYKLSSMFMFMITILVIFTSIGYSALSSSLMISGEAYVRVLANVRITNVTWLESNNQGYETYNSEYYKEGIKVFATLPNIDSSITYKIEITNNTDIIYIIDGINELINSNELMTYTIENIDKDILNKQVTTFNITIKYKDTVTEVPSNNMGAFELKLNLEIKDVTPPILTTKLVSKTDKTATINIKATDEINGSGLSDTNIYKYCLSTSSTTLENCTWENYTNGSNFNVSVTNYGNYYLFVYAVSDNAGNISDNKVSNQTYYQKLNINFFNPISTYDYTGGEQIYTVPESGYYKLETWGAQGGYAYNTSHLGGYGGYSRGTIYLNKGANLYINVGGKGADGTTNTANTKFAGGYNGGGNGLTFTTGDGRYAAGGGGATHIATKSGLLSSLSSSNSSLLIVSGGGAGSGYYLVNYYTITPGSGGGITGTTGTAYYSGSQVNYSGGTQTTGYAFGQGSSNVNESPGGGGGYYGGTNGSFAAGGGSGYIGNSLLTNKAMYCYNCTTSSDVSTKTISTTNVSGNAISNYAKSGNGYARITFAENLNVEIESKLNNNIVNIKININNKTSSELSEDNIYKYYLSTSSTELIGGTWQDYTPGVEFQITEMNSSKYLWIYSISTQSGIINDNQETANTPYMVSKISILPTYTYTGKSALIDDGDDNWRIKFLTSGTLTLDSDVDVDIFLVGGGGTGRYSGGGGGYTRTVSNIKIEGNKTIAVVVGKGATFSYTETNNGGESSILGYKAAGGYGVGNSDMGGNGGSGGGAYGYNGDGAVAGKGGTNGADGTNSGLGYIGGRGQISTPGPNGETGNTREFGEATGDLYAGGGAGSTDGGGKISTHGTVTTLANSGRGNIGGNGYDGIVIIRNNQTVIPDYIPTYTYTGDSRIVDDGNGNYRIRFLTSGTLVFNSNCNLDVFLVGAGGGSKKAGGGGGGYTLTKKNISASKNTSYQIVIGQGVVGADGGSTSAFGFTASGGKVGNYSGGNGGSGGGAGASNGTTAGTGGQDGNNGSSDSDGTTAGGTGQGTTTREFGESSGIRYAGGGSGAGYGSGAKGNGVQTYGGGVGQYQNGINYTGGGGGGGGGTRGGSGIVIIRNAR